MSLNNNNLFFNKDPTIIWTKYLCPLCHEPTGSDSQCYNMDISQSIPPYAKNMAAMGIGNSPLPIFGINCVFRQENLWDADINYPVSLPLVNKLSIIQGVNKITPIKPYSFRVSIARAFNEIDVKRSINLSYKTFIKEMSVSELELIIPKGESLCNILGIEFPNGGKYIIDPNLVGAQRIDQINYVKSLLDSVSGSKLIVED